jgi:hypothetical protein
MLRRSETSAEPEDSGDKTCLYPDGPRMFGHGQPRTIESVIMTARTPMSAKAIRPAGAHGQVAESTTGPVGERLRKLAGISPKPTSDIGHTPPFPHRRHPHGPYTARPPTLYG